jgi:hypothetical protein
MENDKNKTKIALAIVGIMLVITIVVGLTYAYWTVKVTETSSNVINTGCLSINLIDETDAINLQDAFPISDEAAENLKPYTFKIENICNISINYEVTLEIMGVDNRLESKYIAANFNGEGKKLLSSFTSVDPTYSDNDYKAVEARKLVTGSLDGKSSISYTLNLWIDESVEDSEAMDKNFTSKVSITIFKEQVSTKTTLVDYITTLAETDTTNLVADDGTDDNNIRYIGKDPDNYLCFDKSCTNGVWRVIGIMNNMTTLDGEKSLVKIVRAYSIGSYAWSTYGNNYFGGGGTSDWSNGSLTEILNSSDWWTSNLANYTNLIESVTWNLGRLSNISPNEIASTIYTDERSSNSGYYGKADATWTGKVGLIYPSDYAFATSGGDTGRDICLSQSPSYWRSFKDCYNYNYLYDSSSIQWTLTAFPYTGNDAMVLYTDGNIAYQQVDYPLDVHPSLYLVENTYIVSGNGTSDNPWIIGI